MAKFTPSSQPKHVKLHDTSTKKHISFDDDDETPTPTTAAAPSVDKKRSEPDQGVTTKSINNKRPRSIAPQEVQQQNQKKAKGNAIKSPKDRPYLQKVEYKKKEKKPLTAAQQEAKDKARGLAKRDAKRRKLKERRQAKKIINAATPGDDSKTDANVTGRRLLQLTPENVKGKVRMADLQNFVLYCLTEGAVPKFARIPMKSRVDRLVVIYVRGLDITCFGAPMSRVDVPPIIDMATVEYKNAIGKANMPFLMSQSSHMLVTLMESSKPDRTMYPISDLLQCSVSWSRREKQYQELKEKLENSELDRSELYILKPKELASGGYPVPPFLDPSVTLPEDWKETKPGLEPLKKKRIIAVDCEMVLTTSGSSLARVSLVDEAGQVLLDEYVLPDKPIVDYLTEYSGITKKIMDDTTCSLRRAQKHVRKLVDHNVILVGHSLDSDLKALKLAHPYCVDTALLYDSIRGPPFRPRLRSLAKQFLKRNIQQNNTTRQALGHNSSEDARATMDLFKLKIEKGYHYGRRSEELELVFDRLTEFTPARKGMIMETRVAGTETFQSTYGSKYACFSSDMELADNVAKEVSADQNFVLAQLDAIHNLNDDGELPPNVLASSSSNDKELATRLSHVDDCIKRVYEGVPKNTAIMVMGGVGNVYDYQRLIQKYRDSHTFSKKRSADDVHEDMEPGVTWTEEDANNLKDEYKKARQGCAFVTMK